MARDELRSGWKDRHRWADNVRVKGNNKCLSLIHGRGTGVPRGHARAPLSLMSRISPQTILVISVYADAVHLPFDTKVVLSTKRNSLFVHDSAAVIYVTPHPS